MSSVREAVTSGAPDPEDALRRLERLEVGDRELDPDELAIAVVACQRAPYLVSLIARDPERLRRVARDRHLRREKPAAKLRAEMDRAMAGCRAGDDADLDTRLRRFRDDEMVRLGARELGLGRPDEVGRELSHLSDVCFDAAIRFHRAALDQRFGPARAIDDSGAVVDAELTVIGMGKLGGEELNFSSDVDVIYVYSSDASPPDAAITLHEYFAKLCERVTASIGRVTSDGVVFRVDLRLRPEGSRGPIANSLPSLEHYYESWGRPWERQAWIKARACAGSRELGAAVLDMLRPFVFPRSTSTSVVDDVTELNRRIKAELDSKGIDSGFDVKNGVGGIREIEFFAQALQLIHAGQRPALRVKSTIGALDQLLFAGLVAEAEHRTLVDAYRYLRRVEHMLQLDSGRQTQRLPAAADALAVIARRLGLAGTPELARELSHHTGEVASLFATLGEPDEVPPEVQALLSGDLDADGERRALTSLGFRDPERASENLERARRRVDSPFGAAARGAPARVGPALLAEVARSPDPDRALGYVGDLIARRGGGASVWALMADNPPVLRLIASLFGTSEYLSRQFIMHPELIDALLLAGVAHPRADAARLDAMVRARFAPLDPADDEAHWNALAELKNTEVLRIGLADIGGTLSALEVCDQLSQLAQVCLRHAHDVVERGMIERHGRPRDADGAEVALAVIGLGKLGGGELGYASDLDVVFVYSADGDSDGARPIDNVSYMTRFAQRLMSGLHVMHEAGRLYEVDTRLRPSGGKGLLVSSLAGWERYHAGEARLWERQALIKLRPIAGDPVLGDAVARAAARCVWGERPADVDHIAIAITGMRDRIERELARGADVKAGRGGLIDIEFAAQYLQLAYGHDHPTLRVPSTIAALERASAVGVVDPHDASVLVDAYGFLRRLEHRMRIVHDRSVQVLPDDPAELEKLARRVGLSDGRALAEELRRWTTEVRATYVHVLGSR